MANWPTQAVLPIKVEILLNGTWTDITPFVYSRDDIIITGGGQDQAKKPPPAQMTLTLNNTDFRFSPNNTSGAYYPYLVRNTQIRLSINNVSSITGNTYTGYRFWGKVADWPPQGDITGTDLYVQITANGPLREINKGGGKGSALARYYATLTSQYAPIAYWPCEEDPGTNQVQAGLQGGAPMFITGPAGAVPNWKSKSDFNGSSPIGIPNKTTWTGSTGSVSYSGDDTFTTAGTYQWVSPVTGTVNVKCTAGGGGGGGGYNPQGVHANAGGGGGGGGERAQNTAVAVTAGVSYTVIVGAGGPGGTPTIAGIQIGTNGSPGTASSFTGDAVTVTANPGQGGGLASASTNGTGGAGGSGSTAPVEHAGGAGAVNGPGGGGGGSGGDSAAGNPGSLSTGGAAVTGGGPGGNGGGSFNGVTPSPPGGGGGGGGASIVTGGYGGNGATGKVEIIYTPPAGPTNVVFRGIILAPTHGGNDGKVLCRALLGGTLARVDVVYGKTGQLKLQGYNSTPSLVFDSGFQSWNADGSPIMFSVELSPSGANVAYTFKAIAPGATSLLGSVSGTGTTLTLGNATSVVAAPNGDITKTAMGHFSIQYALLDLLKVSDGIADALNGHIGEATVDRLARLLAEQAIGLEPVFAETQDHWGFETGTQNWNATNCTVTQSSVSVSGSPSWPPEGTHSLLMTCNGVAASKTASLGGTSGLQCSPGDVVSVHISVYTPVALTGQLQGAIGFFNSAGTFISSPTVNVNTINGQIQTIRVSTGPGGAPAGTAFLNVGVNTVGIEPANRLIYIDHVRISARMGAQTRKYLKEWIEEIKDLEQAMYADSRKLYGLKFRTRVSLLNQSPALTLNYTAQHLSQQLAPVYDDLRVQNDITVRRHKGSKVRVVDITTTQQPPNGVGPYKKEFRVVAEIDDQLAALAAHMLALGKDLTERYPIISVNLARPAVASILSTCAGVEIGDYVQLTNLPNWLPSATAKQLVVGYTETLNNYKWTIDWNCVPELPFEITSYRRW